MSSIAILRKHIQLAVRQLKQLHSDAVTETDKTELYYWGLELTDLLDELCRGQGLSSA